ncbi:hypothetical protein H6A61_04010 [Bacteroides caecigallinarum]|uniref:hypothetical protein n=1 Tax=Bacteroides caecigallinarum TaxID=1411144 RepID=UPI00195D9F0B|nr:hypothetical protein [Bacteroides caecigallinarum]MBM6960021.1 hypothetical protein [Bacteroides caecigallinarum]
MNRVYYIILFALFPIYVLSQNIENISVKDSVVNADNIINSEFPKDSLDTKLFAPITPVGMSTPFGMYGITPFSYNYANWELHKGFNASLGMHVTFSPSKYAPSGVGFGQDAAFMYAVPINNRLSVAGGLYATNMDWGFINYKNIGIAGVAAFKLNDKITLYGYGNKSLMPQRSPLYYPLPNFSPDKLGGMINFKIGESSSISFGVEGIKGYGPYYW